jgi:hypothetical protein
LKSVWSIPFSVKTGQKLPTLYSREVPIHISAVIQLVTHKTFSRQVEIMKAAEQTERHSL